MEQEQEEERMACLVVEQRRVGEALGPASGGGRVLGIEFI